MADIKLYAHPPASLLPLLEAQLPHTLVLLSTIQANRHAESDPSPVSAPDCHTPPPLPPVYATFPPPPSGVPSLAYLQSIGVGPYDWLVAVALPKPSEQIRFYHALVANPAPAPAPEQVERAEKVVEAALRFMVQQYPDQLVYGATHEMWEPVARGVLGGRTQVPTYIYVAPNGGFGSTSIRNVPPKEKWEGELVLDHGRESDKDLVSSQVPVS